MPNCLRSGCGTNDSSREIEAWMGTWAASGAEGVAKAALAVLDPPKIRKKDMEATTAAPER